MPRTAKPLTHTEVDKAKPRDKPYKLFDGKGLHLLVKTNGKKYWRFDYGIEGRRKTVSLGIYPGTSLARAREERSKAANFLLDGIDPAVQRKNQRSRIETGTFEALAREWLVKQKPQWCDAYAKNMKASLENNLIPWLGKRPIEAISARDVLETLRRIEKRGAAYTAQRANQIASAVFRYAIVTGQAERDVTADLRGALETHTTHHHAAELSEEKIAEILRAMDGYKGGYVVQCALRLTPLVFLRPVELRTAQWAHINLDAAEWRIPSELMKMRRDHIIPLARQSLALLRDLQPLTGRGFYVFPGARNASRPMSENTINAALRYLGIDKKQQTAHGFRRTASTRLHEMGWPSDAIERQLAHAESNKIKGVYNAAEHLPKRREMMQAWADYLDGLKSGAQVVPIRQKKA